MLIATFGKPKQGARALLGLALGLAALSANAIVGGTFTVDFKTVGPGVQFAPNWVLTANHVGLAVGTGYINGHGTSLIDAVYTPPGAGGFPAHDLRLVHLANAINAPPLPLSSTLYNPVRSDEVDFLNPTMNIDVTLTTDSTQFPRGYAHGQLREFIDVYADDQDNNPLTPPVLHTVNWLLLHQNTLGVPYVQGGDSGGGLFMDHVLDDVSPLMGIATAQLDQINGPGTTAFASAYVSLAAYRNWIDATMLADTLDNQVATWVTTAVPEPATWLMGLVGGLGLASVRRVQQRR
jgi:hypothetical protein